MTSDKEKGFSVLCYLLSAFFSLCPCVSVVRLLWGQIESVEVPPSSYHWTHHIRLDGHLALDYSPAGAFSPDSSALAVVSRDTVVLANLRAAAIRKVLRPRIERVTGLEIQSANFLATNRLLILASGLVQTKVKGVPPRTPELAFQWDTELDTLSGKVNGLGLGGGFGPPRYFPDIRYVGLNKENNFDLWNPSNGRGGRINIPSLTRASNLYSFSPDGRWLLLAQIQTSSAADPVVVQLSNHEFVDSLRGHQGTVLAISFSRDSRMVATACEDRKVRVWSVGDWKLLQTLEGHLGPVHWAEFSPDGKWLVSSGEDKTVRIWSAEDGMLVQTLEESPAPVFSAAFSPNAEYVTATTEKAVLVWKREGGG